jgi:hypothetical protein
MIITKKKPEETIDAMIAPFPKLFVVGCGTCSTKCMSGGEEQVAELVERLGDRVIGSQIVEEPCDKRLTRRDLKEYKDKIKRCSCHVLRYRGPGHRRLCRPYSIACQRYTIHGGDRTFRYIP